MLALIDKPKKRSARRLAAGRCYFGLKRKWLWFKMRHIFARSIEKAHLPYRCFSHETPLIRNLKNVDMWMQHNKITNLKLAVECVNGVLLRPGVGGGLCQLSNLIFWMTIHTPLTVVERHRHGYDVFPDSNRTQPFGSGATCFYPYGDLMIRNDTPHTYQLCARVGAKNLEGEWRISSPPEHRFEIVEKNHEMRGEYWGGFTRHNELYQRKYSLSGDLLSERLITRNTAIMMCSPFLEGET